MSFTLQSSGTSQDQDPEVRVAMPRCDSSALICKRNVAALRLVTTGLSAMDTVALGTAKLPLPPLPRPTDRTCKIDAQLNYYSVMLAVSNYAIWSVKTCYSW